MATRITAWAGWVLFTFGCAGDNVTIWSVMIGVGLLVQAFIMREANQWPK